MNKDLRDLLAAWKQYNAVEHAFVRGDVVMYKPGMKQTELPIDAGQPMIFLTELDCCYCKVLYLCCDCLTSCCVETIRLQHANKRVLCDE